MLAALELEVLAYLAVVAQLEAATDAALAKEPKRPDVEPYFPDVDIDDPRSLLAAVRDTIAAIEPPR